MSEKQIARSILDLTTSGDMLRILDRSQNVDDLIAPAIKQWSYDLYARRPGFALTKNNAMLETDLDLACFLSALVDRGAVICLPEYENRRPRDLRAGQYVTSRVGRHGQILGLVANKDVFSFSARIWDANVIVPGSADGSRRDSVGAFRSFMVVDLDGTWHDGWKSILFWPSAKENDFLFEASEGGTERDEIVGRTDSVTITFKNFVHPNRWISFYGAPYLQTKLLLQRLEEECVWYRAQHKALREERKMMADVGTEGENEDGVSESEEAGISVKVPAFAAEVDAPMTGDYPAVGPDRVDFHALHVSEARLRKLHYTLIPQLRFAVRATELAFYKAGMMSHGFPAWIKNAAWEIGYVKKGGRTQWNRLVLNQLWPGQIGFALRYREREISQKVA